VFHERDGAFDRAQVGGWLSVSGTLVVALLCGAPSGASDRQSPVASRPDFSGQWVLEGASPSGPDVPRTLSVRQFQLEKGERGDSTKAAFESIAIDRNPETGPTTESHRIGIIGGTVGGIGKDGRSRFTSYGVTWDGNALVFENESYTKGIDPPAWSERREIWSMDEAGRLRVVITDRSSDGSAGTLTLIYRRR
jgi:hypothetical protein